MLAALLPGVRELRAPLAAGYILLLAGWLLLEDRFPTRGEADGLTDAIYRLSDLSTAVGVGVAVSFVAYLIGSLSAFLFAPFLQWCLRARVRRWRQLDTVTAQSRDAMDIVAGDALARLQATLALSGHDIDDVLHTDRPSKTVVLPPERRPYLSRMLQRLRRITMSRQGLFRAPGHGVGSAMPEGDPTGRWKATLYLTIREDLDVIATTRLLGEKPDHYMAIDRTRAEADFRFAVVVPVAVLAVAAGVRAGDWAAIVVVVGLSLAVAIFFDAVRSQRTTNQIVVGLLENGVVTAPAMERLEERARALAQADSVAYRGIAEQVDQAIKGALRTLRSVGTSEPTLAYDAKRATGEARGASEAFRAEFPDPAPFRPLDRTVGMLEVAADMWVALNEGRRLAPEDFPDELRDAPPEDARDLVALARGAYLQFTRQVRQSLARLSIDNPAGLASEGVVNDGHVGDGRSRAE